MNHLGIVSVDAQSHVICGAAVDYADKKDCMLADAGYSSGETFSAMGFKGVNAAVNAMKALISEKIQIWDRFILFKCKILAV